MTPDNTPAFTLTVTQLEESIKAWMAETVDSLPFTPVYLTRIELADKLKITLPTLHEYTTQGIIPHLKFGKSIRYVEQDVYKALKNMSSGYGV